MADSVVAGPVSGAVVGTILLSAVDAGPAGVADAASVDAISVSMTVIGAFRALTATVLGGTIDAAIARVTLAKAVVAGPISGAVIGAISGATAGLFLGAIEAGPSNVTMADTGFALAISGALIGTDLFRAVLTAPAALALALAVFTYPVERAVVRTLRRYTDEFLLVAFQAGAVEATLAGLPVFTGRTGASAVDIGLVAAEFPVAAVLRFFVVILIVVLLFVVLPGDPSVAVGADVVFKNAGIPLRWW